MPPNSSDKEPLDHPTDKTNPSKHHYKDLRRVPLLRENDIKENPEKHMLLVSPNSNIGRKPVGVWDLTEPAL